MVGDHRQRTAARSSPAALGARAPSTRIATGSDRLVGLKMAEVYEGLQLLVLPSDGAAGVNPLDLEKTMKLFAIQGTPPARGEAGGPR